MSLLVVAVIIVVVWLIVFAYACALAIQTSGRVEREPVGESPWLGDVEWLWPPERRR